MLVKCFHLLCRQPLPIEEEPLPGRQPLPIEEELLPLKGAAASTVCRNKGAAPPEVCH